MPGRFHHDWFGAFARFRPYILLGADNRATFGGHRLFRGAARLATRIEAATGQVPTVRLELP